MVDYSKWDALELSDDSDIEVHPNVDKRSFIRAKQNQIHMNRQERKRQIKALKYEHVVNSTLVQRLSDLLSALKLLTHDAQDSHHTPSPADAAFQIIMGQVPHNFEDDYPPPRPENVFDEDQPLPSYSKMMAGILDEVKKTLDAKHIGRDERYATFVEEVGVHFQKIQDLQGALIQKLDALEKEDSKMITSESYHTGFDSSHVNKARSSVKPEETTNVELLNPNYDMGKASSGGETQVTDPSRDSDEEPKASPAARKFAQIGTSDYRASHEFLSSHPEILQESETDGLLVDAFKAALEQTDDTNDTKVWQYVHHAMLLQFCRILGRDGIAIFFKRVATPGHQARQMFEKEVAEKVQRIKEVARENANRLAAGDGGGVEQIQLHAVEPGTSIQIQIPQPESGDEEAREAKTIFDGFALDMRTALESGSLDEVNRVLGAMDIPEAERLVGLLGDAGCISVEKEIIDATTEEGRKYLRDMENDVTADAEVESVEVGNRLGP